MFKYTNAEAVANAYKQQNEQFDATIKNGLEQVQNGMDNSNFDETINGLDQMLSIAGKSAKYHSVDEFMADWMSDKPITIGG